MPMEKGKHPEGFKGQRGTLLHDAIVDWTRFDLIPYLRSTFKNVSWHCVYHETGMAMLLNTRGKLKQAVGSRYPDGLWIYKQHDRQGLIVIEVGKYNLNDTLRDQQAIHIGFDGQINVVNPHDSFVMDVGYAIRQYRDVAMGELE